MPQALMLLNPKSQQGDTDISQGLDVLRKHGIGIIRETPHSRDEAMQLIRQHRNAIDRVIVGGGDGSLHMALSGLMECGLPLGIMPLGTANDLARTLDLPNDLTDACRIIAGGRLRRIDVGEVNGRYFLNAANIGLGVEVARRLNGQAKKHFGVLAYLYSTLDALRATRTFHAEIHCNGRAERLRAVQIAVGNGRFYGGGMCISEKGAIDDGHLDLYAVPAQSLGSLLTLGPALRHGRMRGLKNVLTLEGSEIRIHTRHSKTVTADGESATQTPAVFRVLPGALSVYSTPARGTRP